MKSPRWTAGTINRDKPLSRCGTVLNTSPRDLAQMSSVATPDETQALEGSGAAEESGAAEQQPLKRDFKIPRRTTRSMSIEGVINFRRKTTPQASAHSRLTDKEQQELARMGTVPLITRKASWSSPAGDSELQVLCSVEDRMFSPTESVSLRGTSGHGQEAHPADGFLAPLTSGVIDLSRTTVKVEQKGRTVAVESVAARLRTLERAGRAALDKIRQHGTEVSFSFSERLPERLFKFPLQGGNLAGAGEVWWADWELRVKLKLSPASRKSAVLKLGLPITIIPGQLFV